MSRGLCPSFTSARLLSSDLFFWGWTSLFSFKSVVVWDVSLFSFWDENDVKLFVNVSVVWTLFKVSLFAFWLSDTGEALGSVLDWTCLLLVSFEVCSWPLAFAWITCPSFCSCSLACAWGEPKKINVAITVEKAPTVYLRILNFCNFSR